jgi:hypothetical protein
MTARIGHGFGGGCSVDWDCTVAEGAMKKSTLSKAMTELRLGLTMLAPESCGVGWW